MEAPSTTRLRTPTDGTNKGVNKNGDSSTTGGASAATANLLPNKQHTQNNNGNNSDRRRKRQWAIWWFSITTVLLFADQNLMAPNLTAIAEDFGFTDDERDQLLGGNIALAFWVLGAPAGILVGCLADRWNRSILFAIVVGVGEFACFLTFWAHSYPFLYVCRAATGLGIGGALPLVHSLIGDYCSTEERHSVIAYVGIGMHVGTALGQGIAGYLGPVFGWRLPFLLVSVPALVCALVVYLTVEDPERGAMEAVILDYNNSTKRSLSDLPSSSSTSTTTTTSSTTTPMDYRGLNVQGNGTFYSRVLSPQLSTLGMLFSTPTVVFALIQGSPGCVPWGIVNTYLNDFLAEDRGMSVEFATFVVMCFGVGSFLGNIVGGSGGQYLYNIDKRFPALLAGSTAILGCVPFWVLLNNVDNNSSFVFTVAISVMAGLLAGITGPIIKATLCNTTLPTSRGQAFALFTTFDDFGRGLGPVFVALMIRDMGGRTVAFNIATLGWMVCGVINTMVFFTVERDERRCQASLSKILS